jgi:hypothetical protein
MLAVDSEDELVGCDAECELEGLISNEREVFRIIDSAEEFVDNFLLDLLSETVGI